MKVIKWINGALKCPFFMGMLISSMSALSLAAAYTAEYGFGLLPCILCLYQRIPFAIGIILGLGVLLVSKAKKFGLSVVLLGLSGVTFLANSALAFYHSGVERKWWLGFEGCGAPDISGLSPEEIMEALSKIPAVRCDEIPWEMFGLSMANYNVALCFGLSALCFFVACRVYIGKVKFA